VFILFLIPLSLTYFARKHEIEKTYGHNFNKSPFKHPAFLIIILCYAVITLVSVIVGLIISGGGGGH
jgi:hypothetical protein